jgi:hypothetical protein
MAVDSELIDTLQTELNKYKIVVEAEKPVEVLWFESKEFHKLVTQRLNNIEKEVGGFGDVDSESGEAGEQTESRVDIIEKRTMEALEKITHLNERIDGDMDDLKDHVVKISKKDDADLHHDLKDKIGENWKETKDLAKKFENQVFKHDIFTQTMQRIVKLE